MKEKSGLLMLPPTLIAGSQRIGVYTGNDLCRNGRIVCSEHGTVEE